MHSVSGKVGNGKIGEGGKLGGGDSRGGESWQVGKVGGGESIVELRTKKNAEVSLVIFSMILVYQTNVEVRSPEVSIHDGIRPISLRYYLS